MTFDDERCYSSVSFLFLCWASCSVSCNFEQNWLKSGFVPDRNPPTVHWTTKRRRSLDQRPDPSTTARRRTGKVTRSFSPPNRLPRLCHCFRRRRRRPPSHPTKRPNSTSSEFRWRAAAGRKRKVWLSYDGARSFSQLAISSTNWDFSSSK